MSADPALIRLPLQAQLTRLDTGSAVRRVKSPPVDIPVALPLLPRWDELASWMQQIDRSRVYTNRGPLCNELEARLAAHYGCASGDDAVCLTASGTLGLVACLLALDLEPGSICALPSWTFVASADAVVAAGLVPYLLDVELDTWALAPEHVEAQIAKMPQRPSESACDEDPGRWRGRVRPVHGPVADQTPAPGHELWILLDARRPSPRTQRENERIPCRYRARTTRKMAGNPADLVARSAILSRRVS